MTNNGVPEQRPRAVAGTGRARVVAGAADRGLARDLASVAVVVASAALVVAALVAPTSRFAPALLPDSGRTVPGTASPAQVGGVVVTRDTGGVIVRRGIVTGPVGGELVELAAAALPPRTAARAAPPARTAGTSEAASESSAAASTGDAAPTGTTAPPGATTTPAADVPDEPDPLTAASDPPDRRPGWRGRGADRRPSHAAAATKPPAQARASQGAPPANANANGNANGNAKANGKNDAGRDNAGRDNAHAHAHGRNNAHAHRHGGNR